MKQFFLVAAIDKQENQKPADSPIQVGVNSTNSSVPSQPKIVERYVIDMFNSVFVANSEELLVAMLSH